MTYDRRALIGKRVGKKGMIAPADALAAALKSAEQASTVLIGTISIDDAKKRLASACKEYYTLAAVSRRKTLAEHDRTALLSKLFHVRSSLERAISQALGNLGREYALSISATKSFFGASAKQGISIRYALASCVPTKLCSGRCYAHDGRDRELHHLFRGAINWHLGVLFEEGTSNEQQAILRALSPHARRAAATASQEASQASLDGFVRKPRIRFSHVGDMAATPTFANAVGRLIKSIDPHVACVMYTRHPNASSIDSSLFVINFSIDNDQDPRIGSAPPGAQIVCSAWDGVPSTLASVNFLEHHVERVFQATASLNVCPAITADKDTGGSCDAVGCDKCFRLMDLLPQRAPAALPKPSR